MSCTGHKPANFEKAVNKIREAAAKGAQIVLPAGAFYFALFLRCGRLRNFKLAEVIPVRQRKCWANLLQNWVW